MRQASAQLFCNYTQNRTRRPSNLENGPDNLDTPEGWVYPRARTAELFEKLSHHDYELGVGSPVRCLYKRLRRDWIRDETNRSQRNEKTEAIVERAIAEGY